MTQPRSFTLRSPDTRWHSQWDSRFVHLIPVDTANGIHSLAVRHYAYARTGTVFDVCALKVYRGSRGILPLILNLGTRWRWVASLPPGNCPSTYIIRGCLGPKAVLDDLGGIKIPCLYRDTNHRLLKTNVTCSFETSPTTYLKTQDLIPEDQNPGLLLRYTATLQASQTMKRI